VSVNINISLWRRAKESDQHGVFIFRADRLTWLFDHVTINQNAQGSMDWCTIPAFAWNALRKTTINPRRRVLLADNRNRRLPERYRCDMPLVLTTSVFGIRKKKIPWSESASELYRPSDRRLSAKWLPACADRRCHVVSVTDRFGRILGFLDRSRYFSVK
jgi:hypothetical protein